MEVLSIPHSVPSCRALPFPSSLLWDVSDAFLSGLNLPTKQTPNFSCFCAVFFYQTDELRWLMEASGGEERWEGRKTTVVSFSDNKLLNLLIPSLETDTRLL